MRGVYQHCAEKHLHRYLAEFEFRYSHREATAAMTRSRRPHASWYRRQAPDLSNNCCEGLMPKAKNPMTEEERSKRFEEEVRRRKAAGDFDPDAAPE
jgi:hypothetical protein